MQLLIIKIWQQLYLVVIATSSAIVIGVTLGIIVSRVPKLKTIVLGIANVLQTIPSLALLGFLLPVFGIGVKPAIIALTLYALLPIVRNTVIGLANVPASSLEAARALGFTNMQRLRLVELPLAASMIMGGIRTATVISVGIATIAAFIGAGGLGDFIFEGLALNNSRLILLGAVPAAAMALILDYIMGRMEKSFNKKWLIGLAVLIVGVGLVVVYPQKKTNTVVIATKNFTEQYILGEMMAQLIDAKTHLKVIRKFNLGTTAMCQQALLRGDIDMYPEYTGTAYLVVLKQPYKNMNSQQLYTLVKRQYQKRYQLTWLAPFGFNNTQAVAVRSNFATKYQLTNISDLKRIEHKITFAAPPEFMKRPDGFRGLKQFYQLQFAAIKSLAPDLMYQAIHNKSVNAIMAFATDGRIRAYKLVTLDDDKHLYPAYYAAPVIRASVLKAHPEIKAALQPLAGLINNATMQQLNYQVNVEKLTPAIVAHRFLVKKRLL